ncbi:MAG: choice-of-anchor D domain-containing protein [Bacteroidales bacterium]|nr:choice-of-anchor D domain-containing protein [Bacteroidales bacterium]
MRKLFTLLILLLLWTAGMTQEKSTVGMINTGSKAPVNVQTQSPLAPMAINVAITNQSRELLSVSNILEKKVKKVNVKSLPETTINPLAPLQGGENIATAFVLTGALPITSSGTTSGYANDYNEDCPYTGSTAPDVVYAYTPAADIMVDIDLCGSSYDTKVFVYENAATPGTPFACSDDFYTASGDPCGQWVSKIEEASLTGGNTYYIVIDGYSGTDFGNYNLEIREFTPPPPCVWGVDIIPPVGAIAESEACGADANGGCNMAAGTETWETIPSTGGSFSGTMWSTTGTRDTDWYELVLTSASSVVLSANSDIAIIYGYITGTFTPGAPDCALVTSISPNNTAGPCSQTFLDMGVLSAGTYWFFVSVPSYIDNPCDKHYWITYNVTPELCPPPSALTVSNKTTTTADLGWTAGGTETGWLVEVGLPGFTPGNEQHIFKDSPVTNSVTATGLSAATAYQFYAQSDCGSAWAGPVNFATNIECPIGAIAEIEICGDSTNNACNNVLPGNQTYETIAVGQTVCGTSYFDGSTRDSDWYSFTLTEARQVTFTGKADFDLQLLFVTYPCPASVIAAGTALAGVTASVTTQLGPGTYAVWVGPQFTGLVACGNDNQYYATLTSEAVTAYCTPAPTSVDDLGITNITFSTVNNTTGAETGNYGDYSSLIGDVQQVATIPVYITFETGFTYDTKIWIDWNDDFFFDATEEVYSGTSLADNPTTLEASFVVPLTAPLGNHRMRIGGIDFGVITPCYTGSYGTFEDYTVNVTAAPASPFLSVTPGSKNFGTVNIGSSSSQVFTITNTGGGTLTVNPAVSLTGADMSQFILTDLNTYPVSLTTGQSVTVSVAFTPTTAGPKIADLNVVSSAGTTVVSLTGAGYLSPPGSTCENPYPVTLPLVDYFDNTLAYGNDYLSSWVTPATSYLNGYDFVAQFNITEAGHLSGSVVGDWAGVIIVQDCPNPTTPAARLALGSGSLGGSFAGVLVQPGSYFAIVSTWPTPDYTDFTLNLSFTPLPSCPVPTGLTATGMTTTMADLGWTEVGTATSWDLEVIGFDQTPTGVPTHSAVGSNPYTVTGLDASTHYKFYVRAKCAEDSDWSVAKDFYTACGSIDLPYVENFDGVIAPAIPACITVTNNNADAIQWVTSTSSPRSLPNAMRIGYNGALAMDDWFFSPGLNLVPGTYSVSFWYRSSGSYPEALEVKFGSAPNAAGMTSAAIFDNNNINSSVYAEGTGEITITTAGVYYVGWHGYSDADMWYMLVDDISITAPPAFKTLNLTSVLLEGLYAGGGLLNEAYNELAPQFPGNADEITVELRNSVDYSIIEHSSVVLLSLTGSATVTDIPAALNGDYYITVKHRNSVETTTANPVSFALDVVNQSFATPADVYGGNLLLMIDGGYAIFGGDVNQDGSVDGGDVTPFDNDQFNYVSGYVPTDINGDAIIDSGDGTIIDNNQFNYIGSSHP